MFKYNKINALVYDLQQRKKTLTIQHIADNIGISYTMLNQIKNGKSNPTVEVLEKIAIYFGKDMNFFFSDEDKSSKQTKTPQIVSAPVEVYEPPTELKECYKIMFEQQKEITDLTREVERLKNGRAPMNGAHAG